MNTSYHKLSLKEILMGTNITEYKRAFVLLSGGIDSATCLYIAKEHMADVGGTVVAYTVDYGQRHAKEMEHARSICKALNISCITLNLKEFTGPTMLTDPSYEVPDISYSEIEGISPTYVPFRNGAMLSMLAAKAQEYVAELARTFEPEQCLDDLVTLYIGVHAEDAENWAYPDCTPEFIGAMANAIYIGTYRSVRLQAPLNYMTKAEIIRKGTHLEVPYKNTWSCYKGNEIHCGTCPTCQARKQAFKDARRIDPTKYLIP